MASDIAREIVAMSRPRDRPSPYALVLTSEQEYVGEDGPTLLITAPTENGEQVYKIHWTKFTQSEENGSSFSLTDGRVLKYRVKDNLEGAASVVLGFMETYLGDDPPIERSTIAMFAFPENFEMGLGGWIPWENQVVKWSLDQGGHIPGSYDRKTELPRLQIVQKILKALLTE